MSLFNNGPASSSSSIWDARSQLLAAPASEEAVFRAQVRQEEEAERQRRWEGMCMWLGRFLWKGKWMRGVGGDGSRGEVDGNGRGGKSVVRRAAEIPNPGVILNFYAIEDEDSSSSIPWKLSRAPDLEWVFLDLSSQKFLFLVGRFFKQGVLLK